MPLYSGGLCDAVKLMAPSAPARITAYAMAGVGAASAITSGVMPCADKISAAIAQKVSPRNRGSRPTITFAPVGFCETTKRAIPRTARRTFSNVNSSAITARQPEVPNLICVVMMRPSAAARALLAAGSFAYYGLGRGTILYDRQTTRPDHDRFSGRRQEARPRSGGAAAGGLRECASEDGVGLSVAG